MLLRISMSMSETSASMTSTSARSLAAISRAAVSGIGMPEGTRTSPVLRTMMSPTAMRSVIFFA